MILGARLVAFLMSAGGLTLLLIASALALWWPARRRTAAPLFAALAAVYAILGCYPLAARGSAWLTSPFHELRKNDVAPGRTAVVLLGSGSITTVDWQDNQFSFPDPIGATRTLEAARVFRLLDAEWLISSGGEPDPADPDLPSGETMRDTLVRMGVPRERIIVEQESRTTREEAVIVQRLLTSINAEQVVLVTSGMHMRRSLGVFRAAGIRAIPAIARDGQHFSSSVWRLFPSQEGLSLSHLVVHELLGLAYYRLRGWQ